MANFVLDISRIPTGTATVDPYLFCAFTTDQTKFVPLPTTASGLVMGVVMDKIDATKVVAGAVGTIRTLGVAPVRLGTGGCVVGDRLVTATDGRAVVGTLATSFVAGVALQSGTQGGIVDVLLTPGTKWVS